MNNIIVAFPKEEIARNIKKILSQSGYPVTSLCTTGAKALASAGDLEFGILVCGYRFVDMMHTEIFEYLPEGFQMLLVASASVVLPENEENLICMTMPIKVHELLECIEVLDDNVTRYRRKIRRRPKVRSKDEQTVIEKAKELLISKKGITEDEAHKYIQRRSMDSGTSLVDMAEMIIKLME